MQILLCSATAFEIKPSFQFLRDNGLEDKVEVLITGVGMLAATYQITQAVLGKRPDLMLQAGLAGCIDEDIPLGTTAVVYRENLGDMGVLQNGTFTSAFDMGLVKFDEKPWDGGKLANPHADLLEQTGLPLIDSVTVNEISTSEDRISYYKHKLEAGLESMEGAALHFVGLMENIPFLQLRALSNYVGERDKKKWVLDLAIEILNLELQRQLIKLNP